MKRLSKYRHIVSSNYATYVVLIVVLALFVVTLLSSRSSITLLELAKNIIQPFGAFGPIIFILLYIILGLVGFSTSVMALCAIVLFRPVIAFLSIMIGATLAALLAFMFTRSSKIRLAFPVLKRLNSRRSVVYVSKQIERQSKVHGFRLVFLLRLMRLPYIALSYAAGFSPKITTRNFLLATVLSSAISVTILVVIGTVAVVYFAAATVVFIGIGAIYLLVKRRSQP